MEIKTEIDIGKYKINDEESRKCIYTALDLIRKGEVGNWAQLEIRGTLLGIEINDAIFVNLMKYIPTEYVYSFILRSLNECDDCLKFMNYETIESIFLLEGETVHEVVHGFGFPGTFKFSCVDFLGEFEMKHPEIFLKYYTCTEPNIHIGKIKNGYMSFLRLVLRRTKLRASKVDDYKKFIPKLEALYDNYNFKTMFMN